MIATTFDIAMFLSRGPKRYFLLATCCEKGPSMTVCLLPENLTRFPALYNHVERAFPESTRRLGNLEKREILRGLGGIRARYARFCGLKVPCSTN
jgi:hypothetical protein